MYETATDEEPLAPELEFRIYGRYIRHPLLIAGLGYPNAVYNRELRRKRAFLREARAERDFRQIIYLHERPYRLSALKKCIRLGLAGSEYWETLRDVWMDTEFPFQNKKGWIAAWSRETPGREAVMTDQERAALSGMPNVIEVWRGCGRKSAVKGLSWTIDRARGEWFARRFSSKPLLARGLVRRRDVLAFITERKEDEIVARYVKVQEVMDLGPLPS